VLYSLPSIALFIVIPAILGTKVLSTINIIVALTIYTVSLLIRNVIDGLRSVPVEVRQSAIAVGYGPLHRLVAVDLPIAVPVIFAGLRVVTVANISMVSVGAVIGIGGLGELFTLGFQKDFLTPVVVGVVLSLLLALVLRPDPGHAAAVPDPVGARGDSCGGGGLTCGSTSPTPTTGPGTKGSGRGSSSTSGTRSPRSGCPR
jgi:ABC-type proline/glycine betaine transport system permease subunit